MTEMGSQVRQLGEIAQFINGGAWSQSEYSNCGIPVVQVSNIRGYQIDLTDCKYLPKSSLEKYARHLIRQDDLIIATVGSHPSQPNSVVGRPAIARSNAVNALLNQNAVIVRSTCDDVDQKWLGWLGRDKPFRDYIIGCARGAANQVRMAIGLLKQMPINIPPLRTQRRIAEILGAYDDLIEINRRRIAVMEEMAQGLFQELIRDSQRNPSGEMPLSEFVVKTLGGDWGTEEPDGDHTIEVRVVRGTDFSRLQSGDFDSCPTRFITPASANKRLLKPYDVILENSINAKTRSAGSTLIAIPGMIEALGGSVIAASFCRVFQFARPEDAVLFHMWCRHLHASGEIARYQVVAANGIANFQTTQFVRDCVLPFKPTSYEKQREFLVSLIALTYAQQIANLAAARDLLLPRLISGQLSVTDAERELEAA